ncbi:hypothetical protein JMJ77_0007020 [Colletotrichum scovillei]|uniref:Uncharacterized protein n=1 Tax=Colletotrichum scovillei TaxID=1209932 RepID=A0A9P7REH5_9PEZI|nr:hypothetical protein JMJ77_0007020 [Colletotrichum scovillei]
MTLDVCIAERQPQSSEDASPDHSDSGLFMSSLVFLFLYDEETVRSQRAADACVGEETVSGDQKQHEEKGAT